MKIETKFDIGDTAYGILHLNPKPIWEIKGIEIAIYGQVVTIIYVLDFTNYKGIRREEEMLCRQLVDMHLRIVRDNK